jgi:hypothetical protein
MSKPVSTKVSSYRDQFSDQSDKVSGNPKISRPMSDLIKICFSFHNGSKLYYNYNNIKDCCNNIKVEKSNSFTNKVITITVPRNIDEEDLRTYINQINFSNKGNLFVNYTFEAIEKVLNIGEFFENFTLLGELVFSIVVSNINFNNAISLLEFSFMKLSSSKSEIKEIYFRLFYETINFISLNFVFFLERFEHTLTNINKKILEEILAK